VIVGKTPRDRQLDALLDLDGQIFVVDAAGKHWVKFSVKRVEPTPERPHGLSYSLTLHMENGERLVGFDNAHPVRPTAGPSGAARQRRDHAHRLRTVRPYDYTDAATLLTDFWTAVDAVLKERGVLP
jgi:Family of unknown function (DUF6516)